MLPRAFTDAIIADPDDDAPRLIGADWLDEHGEADRAELIRVQCAIAGGERSAGLLARQAQLLDAHGVAWAGEVCYRTAPPVWRRGFVEGVTLRGRDLVARGPGLFECHPVRELEYLETYALKPLLQFPYCGQLCRLAVHLTVLQRWEAERLLRHEGLLRIPAVELYARKPLSGAVLRALRQKFGRRIAIGGERDGLEQPGDTRVPF